MNVPLDFTSTPLWSRTLAEQPGDDPDAAARATLRASYLDMREAVTPLAGDIANSMPSFTVHSIEHCDALWQVGSSLMPEPFPINPAEAYVLGATFLFHDLGMGLSGYERGEADLRDDPLFKDIVEQGIARHKLRAGGDPHNDERAEIEASAIVTVLRRRHARQAERLMSRSFKTSFKDNFFLIEKTDLRHAWGALIGRIAHSHWFDVDELQMEFSQVKGSPAGYPASWEVDPLKIACALRLADACHIDGDRAPTYLSAVRPQSGLSSQHWYFQERLNQPRLDLDRVIYTSNVDFDSEHAQEWWLAFETVNMISRELRRVDALCQDLGRPRFAARSVAGADSPDRFSAYVGAQGWVPVDARLKVSSVEDLAASLGGRNLYGNNPQVALRELIANAADATRARVTQYGVSSDTAIRVHLEERTDGRWWLSVEDRGIGMSSQRLLSALTDFGHSGWTSEDVLDEYPGLVSRGYESIGRFGVGFYSAFMIADQVEVRTLKYREASRETAVLEFARGLSGRPLLRKAAEREEIHVGGTLVQLRLKDPPLSKDGLLKSEQLDGSVTEMFQIALRSMCALLEFDVELKSPGDAHFHPVVRGGEWKVSTPQALFENAYAEELRPSSNSSVGWAYLGTTFAETAKDIADESGDIIGRASLGLPDDSDHIPWWTEPFARVYVGGLSAGEIYGLLGVLVGEPLRADRMRGFPIATPDQLGQWAAEQAIASASDGLHRGKAQRAIGVARSFGARMSDHPIVYSESGYLAPADLGAWLQDKDSIVLIPEWELVSFASGERLKLHEREHGLEVQLPANALYGSYFSDWIFPDEVREYPKDERFKDYGTLEASEFNPRYWWHVWGAIGLPSALMDAITSAWSVDALDIADGTVAYRIYHLDDRRWTLTSVDGSEIKVDAFEIRRPM